MIAKRSRPRGAFARAAGLAVVFVVAPVVVTSSPVASSASENPPVSSFATSVSTAGSTFVSIPMGDLGEPLDTFWQLFEWSSRSTRWTLETPPGIADNGGLVIEGGSPSALTVAIRPSNLLTFTAIATQGDHSGWSNGGLIPGALVGAASAFVGTNDARYAAVDTAGGAVLRSINGSAHWAKIASAASLTDAAAGGCRVAGVRALATSAGSPLYAGVSCSAGGRAGIFEFANSSWRDIGPELGALGGRSSRTVLVLSTAARELDAVIATSSGMTTQLLFARSSTNGATWATSSPILIPSSAGIVSSGAFGSSGAYVVWQKNGLFAAIATARGRWSLLPRLPDGALTLALPRGALGPVDALGGHHSTFLAWRLDSNTSRWQQTEMLAVPILYGSSS